MHFCQYHDADARNLVLSVDGTANQFSIKNTNVIELQSRLVRDNTQRTFYNSGIGTYAKPSLFSFTYLKQFLFHTIDMAIAWNFEHIIHEAYEWLSENYEPGDRIYLFGFSRGAYQVRVIAGMIHKVGLLHKGNKNQISFAYELYASVTNATTRDQPQISTSSTTSPGLATANEHDLCAQFKRTLCHSDVRVHFVGAWDTVSSIGVLRGQSLPETVTGMGHVCAFRHALALDEKRVKFQPEYVNGGLGPLHGDTGNVKEVWFPGTHSDIGGGNRPNADLSNFGPSLRWMMHEASNLGLRLTRYDGQWMTIHPKESLKGVWNLLEYLPIPSLSYTNKDSVTWWPHRGKGRKIQARQLIHESVFRTHKAQSGTPDPPYIPAADLPDDVSGWDVLLDTYPSTSSSLVEGDTFERLTHTLNALISVYNSRDFSTIDTSIEMLRPYLQDGDRLASERELGNAILYAIDAINSNPGPEIQETQCLDILRGLLAYAPSMSPWERAFRTLNIRAWSSRIRRSCLLDLKRIYESLGDPRLNFYEYRVQNKNVQAVSLPRTGLQVILDDTSATTSTLEVHRYNRDSRAPRLHCDGIFSAVHLPFDVAVFSPDGYFVVAASNSLRFATVIEAQSAHLKVVDSIPYPRHSPELDIGDVIVVCTSQDNNHIIFGTDKGFISFSTRRSQMSCCRLRSTTPICHLLSHDLSTVISASSEGVALTNFDSEDLGKDFVFNDSLDITALASCRSTSLIVGGSSSGVLKVWKLDGTSVLPSVSTPHSGIQALAFRPDGLVLASSERLSRHVRLWCCQTWIPLMKFDVQHSASSLTFSFEGQDLVVASAGRVTVFDAIIFNKEEYTEARPVNTEEPGDTEEPPIPRS